MPPGRAAAQDGPRSVVYGVALAIVGAVMVWEGWAKIRRVM